MNEIRKSGWYMCKIKGVKGHKTMYWSDPDQLWVHTRRSGNKVYYKDSEIANIEIINNQLICPMCDGDFVINFLDVNTIKFIYHCLDCGFKGGKNQFTDHVKEIEKDRLLEGEQF